MQHPHLIADFVGCFCHLRTHVLYDTTINHISQTITLAFTEFYHVPRLQTYRCTRTSTRWITLLSGKRLYGQTSKLSSSRIDSNYGWFKNYIGYLRLDWYKKQLTVRSKSMIVMSSLHVKLLGKLKEAQEFAICNYLYSWRWKLLQNSEYL